MPAIHHSLDDGHDRGLAVIAASVVAFASAAVAVALRFYTRLRIVRVLGSEDWLILVALFLSLGVSIANIIAAALGYGQHYTTISHAYIVAIGKTSFALTLLYQVSLCFTKLSILILYLRLLTWHSARWGVWVMLGIVVIYNIWGLISEVTMCIPLSKLWDDKGYGTCHPPSYTWAVIGLHITTDFLIFFLPIPVFFNIKMPAKKKLTILAVFTVGFIACIVSIIRAVRISQLADSVDFSYDNVEITYWNLAEVNVSIICACLMTFKPLISKYWPRWLGSSDALPGNMENRAQIQASHAGGSTRRPPGRNVSLEDVAMVEAVAKHVPSKAWSRRQRSLSAKPDCAVVKAL